MSDLLQRLRWDKSSLATEAADEIKSLRQANEKRLGVMRAALRQCERLEKDKARLVKVLEDAAALMPEGSEKNWLTRVVESVR